VPWPPCRACEKARRDDPIGIVDEVVIERLVVCVGLNATVAAVCAVQPGPV